MARREMKRECATMEDRLNCCAFSFFHLSARAICYKWAEEIWTTSLGRGVLERHIPVLNAVERFLVSHVVHENEAHRPTIIGGRYCAISFLTGSVLHNVNIDGTCSYSTTSVFSTTTIPKSCHCQLQLNSTMDLQ